MRTLDLTHQTFTDTVQKKGIVLVDRWAAWCGPCRAFAPTYEKTAAAHPDIVFGIEQLIGRVRALDMVKVGKSAAEEPVSRTA